MKSENSPSEIFPELELSQTGNSGLDPVSPKTGPHLTENLRSRELEFLFQFPFQFCLAVLGILNNIVNINLVYEAVPPPTKKSSYLNQGAKTARTPKATLVWGIIVLGSCAGMIFIPSTYVEGLLFSWP